MNLLHNVRLCEHPAFWNKFRMPLPVKPVNSCSTSIWQLCKTCTVLTNFDNISAL